MKKLLSFLLVMLLLLASAGCGATKPGADTATPSHAPEESISVPIAYEVDYVDEIYSIGDYVVVDGTWRRRVYGDALEEAMEIFNDKSYDGQYVRIVGQISAAGTNGVTHYHNIRFRNPITNESIVEISLKGCPMMMQDSCIDGEYAVISGKFEIKNPFASLSDCYVECVGEKAKEAYDAVMSGQS